MHWLNTCSFVLTNRHNHNPHLLINGRVHILKYSLLFMSMALWQHTASGGTRPVAALG